MSGKAAGRVTGLVVRPANLLLLIPLLMLVTPWFNIDKPRLLGLPFFYWFQFVFVFIGVIAVWLTYALTRNAPVVKGKPDRLAAEEPDLDEGAK